jgi:hypothetical protein
MYGMQVTFPLPSSLDVTTTTTVCTVLAEFASTMKQIQKCPPDFPIEQQ